MAVFLLLGLAVSVSALPYPTLDEGDACTAPGGGRGECRRVTECLSALEAIRRGARDASSRRCGFVGWEEVVCCPLTDPSLQTVGGGGGGGVQGGRWGGDSGGGGNARDRRRPAFIGNPHITQTVPPTPKIMRISTTLTPPSTVPPAFFGGTGRPGFESSKSSGRSAGKARKACKRYRRIEEQRISHFILGGEEVAEGEFPHMVALGYLRRGQKKISWRCGGTLINEVYVLTAAHCIIDEFAGAPKLVRVGQVDLRSAAGTAGDYRVDSWTLHPRYKRKFNYDDVGLLRLAAPVSFSQNARPACLPQPSTQREQLPPLLRGELIATGWGATQAVGAAPSPVLLKTNVSEVPIAECRSLHRTAPRIPQGISSDMLCAGDPKGLSDTCVGDSGGPLQVLEEPRSAVHTVVGITSFGPGPCGGKKPGVYVRVANYVPWIESIVWP